MASKRACYSTGAYKSYFHNQSPFFDLPQSAELNHLPAYLEAVPPSTGKSMPVMKLLSSEARKTAADASSSAVASRPIGIIFRK
jgi:hypothetical protein